MESRPTHTRESQAEGTGTEDALQRALRAQADPDADERSLIRERLLWTPEERLAANAAFVAFALSARPRGPLLRD